MYNYLPLEKNKICATQHFKCNCLSKDFIFCGSVKMSIAHSHDEKLIYL